MTRHWQQPAKFCSFAPRSANTLVIRVPNVVENIGHIVPTLAHGWNKVGPSFVYPLTKRIDMKLGQQQKSDV